MDRRMRNPADEAPAGGRRCPAEATDATPAGGGQCPAEAMLRAHELPGVGADVQRHVWHPHADPEG
eukprot:12079410-Heterocapsa_arctica.AAC.2